MKKGICRVIPQLIGYAHTHASFSWTKEICLAVSCRPKIQVRKCEICFCVSVDQDNEFFGNLLLRFCQFMHDFRFWDLPLRLSPFRLSLGIVDTFHFNSNDRRFAPTSPLYSCLYTREQAFPTWGSLLRLSFIEKHRRGEIFNTCRW